MNKHLKGFVALCEMVRMKCNEHSLRKCTWHGLKYTGLKRNSIG